MFSYPPGLPAPARSGPRRPTRDSARTAPEQQPERHRRAHSVPSRRSSRSSASSSAVRPLAHSAAANAADFRRRGYHRISAPAGQDSPPARPAANIPRCGPFFQCAESPCPPAATERSKSVVGIIGWVLSRIAAICARFAGASQAQTAAHDRQLRVRQRPNAFLSWYIIPLHL